MSGSSRRNLQRPPSQSSTPVRRAQQGNLSRSSSLRSTSARPVPVSDNESNGSIANTVCADEDPTLSCLLGIPEILCRNLLVDIEAAGGIKAPNFSLKGIINRKPDVYGHTNTAQRRQVQNKVTKLRKLTAEQYLTVLNCFGVQSGALSQSYRVFDSALSVNSITPGRSQGRAVSIESPDSERSTNLSTPGRLQRRVVSHVSPRTEDHQQLALLQTPPRVHRSPHRLLYSAARRPAAMNNMNNNLFFSGFEYDGLSKLCMYAFMCLWHSVAHASVPQI
jgi:hypothetical protein